MLETVANIFLTGGEWCIALLLEVEKFNYLRLSNVGSLDNFIMSEFCQIACDIARMYNYDSVVNGQNRSALLLGLN